MADVDIRIDENLGLARITAGGEVNGEDIVEAAHALHRRPDWNSRYDVIWDGRGITSLIIEPDDLGEMVEAKLEDAEGREVTVVSRELDQMIASLCALLLRSRGREARVCSTLDEALAVLDLDALPAPLA